MGWVRPLELAQRLAVTRFCAFAPQAQGCCGTAGSASMSGAEGRSPRRKHRAAAARLRPHLRPPSHVAIRPPCEASSDAVSTSVMCTHTIYGAIAHLHYCKTVSENRVAISDQQQNRGMISHSKIPRSSICLKLRRGVGSRGEAPEEMFGGCCWLSSSSPEY